MSAAAVSALFGVRRLQARTPNKDSPHEAVAEAEGDAAESPATPGDVSSAEEARTPETSDLPSKWAQQVQEREAEAQAAGSGDDRDRSPDEATHFPPGWQDELATATTGQATPARKHDSPPPDPDEVPIGELPDSWEAQASQGVYYEAPPVRRNLDDPHRPWWHDSMMEGMEVQGPTRNESKLNCSASSCSLNWRRKDLRWQPDESSNACHECNATFNFLRRRHHCRGCGRLLCGDCTQWRALLPVAGQEVSQRVCARCINTTFSLYGAAQAGDAASVRRLVEVQGGGKRCDQSALRQAVNEGNLTAVAVLVAADVDLDQGDDEGVTALMQAAFHGHDKIILVLVEAGANVDKKDSLGRDALDHAARGGHVSAFCQVLKDASLPGDAAREADDIDMHDQGHGGVKLRDMVQWG